MFFKHFPFIKYNGMETRNILLKSRIIEEIFSKYDTFYTYIVKQGESPEVVAYNTYNDPELDWVIYMSNAIIDPYYDWPMDENEFNSFLEMKYNKPAQLTKADIVHYKYTGLGGSESDEEIARKSWIMTVETYNMSTSLERAGWTPVYAYDYEYDLNESKRSIKLLHPRYVDQIKRELAVIFQ